MELCAQAYTPIETGRDRATPSLMLTLPRGGPEASKKDIHGLQNWQKAYLAEKIYVPVK